MGVRTRNWLTAVVLLYAAFKGGAYRLEAPHSYVAFSGDVKVRYWTPPRNASSAASAAVIQLWSLERDVAVTTVAVSGEFGEGRVTVACGVVGRAGAYVFRMLSADGGDVLTQTGVMTVTWPAVRLTLPAAHAALSGDVPMAMTTSAVCDSARHRFVLRLLLVADNDTDDDAAAAEVAPETVHVQPVARLSVMRDARLIFQCRLFDRDARYRVELTATSAAAAVIAASNVMRVRRSGAYALAPRQPSALPCRASLTVAVRQPHCSGPADVVRLYKQIRTAADSAASPRQLVYETDRRAPPNTTAVRFACAHFHERVHRYCFVYLSFALNGEIREETRACLPTLNLADSVVDGNWSAWTDWADCSATCGDGKRNRFRKCDEPEPANGGRFCVGETTQWESCAEPCKAPATPASVDAFTVDPSCECGCALRAGVGAPGAGGKIATSTRRCRGSSTWLVTAPADCVVRLEFVAFSLDHDSTMTWVKVHDGRSRIDDLLVRAAGGVLPPAVTTTGRAMLVEFMAPYEEGRIYGGGSEGFVAVFTAVVSNGSGVVVDVGDDHHGAWQSWMAIVGLLVGALFVALVLAFVCQRRLHAAGGGKRAQDELLNGHLPPDQGSANVTFDPPSDPPAKRSYVLASGREGGAAYAGARSVDATSRLYSAVPTSPSRAKDGAPPARTTHEAWGSPTMTDPRNRSFISAVGAGQRGEIAMGVYGGKGGGGEGGEWSAAVADTSLGGGGARTPTAEPRPPVEGRDSLTRRDEAPRPLHARDSRPASGVSAKSPVGDGPYDGGRPCVKPLPLRPVQRPDGQSPPEGTTAGVTTPSSCASELSGGAAAAAACRLFAPSDSRSPSIIHDAEFEYDDYVPDLPGSYFNMDPHAYTLTWSQRKGGAPCMPGATTTTASDVSADTGASHC